jgi:hypothetical protein
MVNAGKLDKAILDHLYTVKGGAGCFGDLVADSFATTPRCAA